MNCRMCGSYIETKDNWRSILAVGALIGWLAFMAGQVWTTHQINPIPEQEIKGRLTNLEDSISKLNTQGLIKKTFEEIKKQGAGQRGK